MAGRGHGPVSDIILAFDWRGRKTMWKLSWDSWCWCRDSSWAPPIHKPGVVLLEAVCPVPKATSVCVGTVSLKCMGA